jgi:hypothetical protein
MRATMTMLGAALFTLTLTAGAQAWFRNDSAPPPINAFTPNWLCCPCWNGGCYNANSNWPPPCQPFQGFGSRPPAPTGFATQPFARSPRDYFMVDP